MTQPNVDPVPFGAADQGRIFALLEHIHHRQLDTSAVCQALTELQREMPHVLLDVVWETENIGSSVTYCIMATHGGTVYSVSCSRPGVLPWPLRGATNAEANHLVTVNGHTVTVERTINLLDIAWNEADIATRLLDWALFENELDKAGPRLSKFERQDLLTNFYRQRQLTTSAARTQWLRSRGLTEARLAALLEEVALRRQIENGLVGEQCAMELRDNRQAYRGLQVMQAAIPDDSLEVLDSTLRKASPGMGLSSILGRLAVTGALQGQLRIEFSELLPCDTDEGDESVFLKPVGSVALVRLKTQALRLIEIVGVDADVPESTLVRRVTERCMDRWYGQARQCARIEWHWGSAE